MIHKTLGLLATLLLLMPLTLGGCNTARGVGQDIEVLGDTIEDEAEEEKAY